MNERPPTPLHRLVPRLLPQRRHVVLHRPPAPGDLEAGMTTVEDHVWARDTAHGAPLSTRPVPVGHVERAGLSDSPASLPGPTTSPWEEFCTPSPEVAEAMSRAITYFDQQVYTTTAACPMCDRRMTIPSHRDHSVLDRFVGECLDRHAEEHFSPEDRS